MTEPAEDISKQSNRAAFYFYGYDPRSNRYYKNHFKANIEEYLSEHDGRQAAVQVKRQGRDYVITVEPKAADQTMVNTKLVIPDWHPFVKSTLLTNRWSLVRHYNRVVGKLIATGAIWRVWNVWWKQGAVILFFMIVPLLGIPLGLAAALLLPVGDAVPLRAALAVAIAILWFAGGWLWLLGEQFRRFLTWSICFVCDYGGLSNRLEPMLESYDASVERFTNQILAEIAAGERRDILVVGHSIGVIVAIATVARLLKRSPDALGGCRLRLITLGGCWPFLAVLNGPRAARQRDDVRRLLSDERVEWYDIVAWEDILGAPGTDKRLPRILRDAPQPERPVCFVDPVYPTVFEDAFYRRNKSKFALMHFQYINRPQRADGFDLYRLLLTRWNSMDYKANIR